MVNIKKEVTLRSIKILDMGFIAILYVIPSFYVATFIEKFIFPKLLDTKKKDEDKSEAILMKEAIICIIIIGITAYLLRNILQLVPFPFEGFQGYELGLFKKM